MIMTEAVPMRFAIETADGTVHLSPPLFTDNYVGHSPADLSQFAPQGTGVYGYQAGLIDPMKMAPIQEKHGGVVFFGPTTKEDFMVFLKVLGVCRAYKPELEESRYWVFRKKSDTPGADGYFEQIRIVSRFGLRYMFHVLEDSGYEHFPQQELTVPELLWAFTQEQRQTSIAGKFGGDGHWAYEALRFGFMIENDYYGIYRMWSNAWLVTK